MDVIIAGDTLDLALGAGDYSPAAGWTLKFKLTPRSANGTDVTLTATVVGSEFRLQQTAAETAQWEPGYYVWNTWAEKAGERHSVASGSWEIAADPATLEAGYDGRSQAEKAIADLDAALATYTQTNGHVRMYEIAGRRMEFRNPAEIVALRDHWSRILENEQTAADLAKGLGGPRMIFTRFGNV